MNNTLAPRIKPELQEFVKNPQDAMPETVAKVLSPLELDKLWVVHPSDNDPVLVSSKYGAVAIWFKF